MRRRFPLSVRSLLALPLALQALAGAAIVALMAQQNFAVATREAMETSLTIKTQLIHRLLSHELELLHQHAVAFAEEVPLSAETEVLRQHIQRQMELFGLDAVLVRVPNQPPIAIGPAIPLGTEAWLWTDTEIIARAVLPTGTTVSTALGRADLYQMLSSDLSEGLCIQIQTVPPTVPLVLGSDCQISTIGLRQAGSEWQYAQSFATDLGLSWQISLQAPTRHYQNWQPTLAIIALNIGLAIVLGLILSHQLTRPLHRLAHNAKAMSDGDTEITFAPQGIKEIDALAGALLTIMQRLHTNLEDLRESQAQLSRVLDDLPVGVAIH
ncbi:MAG: HAMP domain-containing protein, partial [Synechococcaceae cyanobacterium SM2_3_60]|nr:HAMP domain-containing protein [Synechococcaceae cyanobacterium SM2_3_60]